MTIRHHAAVRRAATGLLVLAGAAWAQEGADPTRPSSAYLAAQPRDGTRAAVQEAATTAPQAQVVVSGPNRRFVVIRGQVVHPGETFGGAKLLSVGPSGAVWQISTSRELQSMTPAVQKNVLSGPGSITEKKKNQRNGEGQ